MGPVTIVGARSRIAGARAAWRASPMHFTAAEIAGAGVILVYALGIHDFDDKVNALADAAMAPAAIHAFAAFHGPNARCARGDDACSAGSRPRGTGSSWTACARAARTRVFHPR